MLLGARFIPNFESLLLFMQRLILLVLSILAIAPFSSAQDTTWVNTLNFDDITKRRGTYQFPEGKTYRKIYMHYTLKCDPRTTRDRFDCGEWDYLSYTIVHDSTGRIDSNRFEHPNFLIGDNDFEVIDYVLSPYADTIYRYDYHRVIDNITKADSFTIGSGTSSSADIFGKNRVQFLFTATELSSAGVVPGDINSLAFFVAANPSSLKNVRIRVAATPLGVLTAFVDNGFSTVYQGDLNTTLGKNKLVSTDGFTWDGVSNIVIEFAALDGAPSMSPTLETDTQPQAGLNENDADHFFKIGDDNFMEIEKPGNVFKDVDSAITIAFWAKGGESLPKNTSVLEAKDKDGKRLLNIHFPWSNGQVYWDAGNSGGYDRINKTVDESVMKSWNHWAFVKNTKTGSMKIYLNGGLWHTGSDKNRELGQIDQFRIGKAIKNYQYEGSLDRVNFWNKELSGAEIADLATTEINTTQSNFSDLICAFSFEQTLTGPYISSDFNAGIRGIMRGTTEFPAYNEEAFFLPTDLTERPRIEFGQYDMTSHVDSTLVASHVESPMVFIDQFGDADNPTVQTSTIVAYQGSHAFSYNPDGTKKDSTALSGFNSLNRTMNPYYVPFEVINNIEIARYITPYGIGLDLGPDGFKWIYDVTDYADLLQGQVTLSAGNQQELIDLRFEMIEGTPSRNIKEVSYYINRESRQYRAIADNSVFTEKSIALHPDAKTHKLITRITGHGHNTSSDNQPHCCEWADKQHYIKINGQNALQWDIWQDSKCAMNPVFDQGGNWAPPRAGWCPAAPVDDYVFDVTDFADGDSIKLDYEIEPVPVDNPGQGGGNYVVSMHLVQYGDYNFENDAAVEQIISPNNWEYYLKMNPTCGEPKIRIRNEGKNKVTEIGLRYGVVGGNPITYYWKGELEKNEAKDIDLPFAIWDYLTEDSENKFYAEVFSVNKTNDDNPANNRAESVYEIPDMAPKTFEVFFRNNDIQDATLQIFNDAGEIVYSQMNAPAGQLVREEITLDRGCYKLVCETENEFGLSYPLIPQIGSGLLRLIKLGSSFNVTFNPDFGKSLEYHFTVGHTLSTKQSLETGTWSLYPNPGNGLITLDNSGSVLSDEYTVRVMSISGEVVLEKRIDNPSNLIQLDITDQSQGVYVVQLSDKSTTQTFKVVKH